MDDLVAFGTLLAFFFVWEYSSHPDPYIYAYMHHLGFGIGLSLGSPAFLLVYILAAANAFVFDAIKVCHREPCVDACRETLVVGVLYISLLVGVQCSPSIREFIYPGRG